MAQAQIREIEGPLDAEGLQALVRDYAPAVLRGVARDWPLVQAAAQSDAAACDHLLGFDRGAAAEAFVGAPAIGGRFFYSDDMRGFNFERRKGKFADLLRYVLALKGRADAPAVYAGAVETAQALPGFADANALPALAGLDAEPRIWIGTAASITTHFDASDNIACVAAGRRRFTLFPPEQTPNLYIGPLDHTVAGQPLSMADTAAPDFARFPRFRDALDAALVAELEPGDAIFIPALWWHQVDALSPFNLLVNFWWTDSPDQDARFDAMVHAILTISHLPPKRREAWAAFFDTFVFQRHGDPAGHMAPEHRGVLGAPTPELRRYIRQYLMRGLGRP
ncbi:cupin-like domain-containing protein [Sphingomonas sp. HITSZ_GF]|uniref:cupin-like domain-containing protein n=1 Tax=Sphingomonas sp. HITSZ_GF TaxID=3037247 RepID=UPI00240D6AAA|nr:cupin-like domain-containing protein [Sphingomonas sp. HITSZ_GF]MDG2534074.1 cupin-like domain-containing protein [Sphingomonas sp. HITSZ_GF]